MKTWSVRNYVKTKLCWQVSVSCCKNSFTVLENKKDKNDKKFIFAMCTSPRQTTIQNILDKY